MKTSFSLLVARHSSLGARRCSSLVTRYSSLVARCSVFIARRSLFVAGRARYALYVFPSRLLPFPHGFGRLEPGGAPGREEAGKDDHHHPKDKGEDGVGR